MLPPGDVLRRSHAAPGPETRLALPLRQLPGVLPGSRAVPPGGGGTVSDFCFARLPVDTPPCWISGGWGDWYGSYQHRGVDIAGPLGVPVYAPAQGRRVSLYNPDGSFGNAIVLDHEGTPWYSILAHLASPPLPGMGQLVQAGALVGYLGNTGQSSGPHVHWQVSNSIYFPPDLSTTVDPLSLMCDEEDDMTPAEVQQMIDAALAPVVAQLASVASTLTKLGAEVDTINDAVVKRMDLIEAGAGPIGNVREAWERLRSAGNIEPGDTGGPSVAMVGAPSSRSATQAGDEAAPPPLRRRYPDADEP